MKKREKMLLGVLILFVLGYFFKTGIGSLNSETNIIELKEYGSADLQQLLSLPRVEKSIKIELDGDDKTNFFDREGKKVQITFKEPVLDEIINGPNGYAAMVNGNFLLEGDKIFDFVVQKIEKNRIILMQDGSRKILERK
ncbi:MAG: hypothetical protein HOE93_03070 [Nitrosopumilus sp.]|jgi:hypothetical protein|nr:hypothetical protein [Nitrosopumilus sp.]MBT5175180.1 hypothetical protein [Candidatus Neomarinimicrobiota bacterium]